MILEEPALEPIYRLNNILLKHLKEKVAFDKENQFCQILVDFKQDVKANENSFKEKMNEYILDIIKLSAVPDQLSIYQSFHKYLQQYLQQLNTNDNLDVETNDSDELFDSFLLRETQKRNLKNYSTILSELAQIKETNSDIEKQLEQLSRFSLRLEDEIQYSKNINQSLAEEIERKQKVSDFDQYAQNKIDDLHFLIDIMNRKLQKSPKS